MNTEVKNRSKRWIFILLIILSILLSVYIICLVNIRIVLIGDKDIYINYNDNYFENGYKASFFNKPLKKIKISNNINTELLGDYKVNYTYQFLFNKVSITRNVHVSDLENPVITLKGEDTLYIEKYSEYKDPGFEAFDNYDGDLTESVTIESDVLTDEIGKYTIKYMVSDSSNNSSKKERTIEVVENNALTGAVSNFTLKGYFTDTILEYSNKEYDYLKDTIFLGDSNVTFLHIFGKHLTAEQTWGKNNLTLTQMNNSTFTTFVNKKESTLSDAINNYHPKYIIISPGIFTILYTKKEDYFKELEILIERFKTEFTSTKLIFTAVFPIYEGSISESVQKRINEYNYYLAKICHENDIKMINFADEVKSENGVASRDYFMCNDVNDCGFHLNEAGRIKYLDYIKHLDFERSI